MKKSTASLKSLALLIAATSASAAFADQTWNGSTDNFWTTAANWSGNALPGAGELVIYNALSTGNLSNWLGQDFTIGGLAFTNPASAVSINSDVNTLTINGNGINMTNATQSLTISSALALGANQSWIVATNQSLTVNGVISSATNSGLAKDGVGTLFLNGANSFTGNVTNNNGPIWLRNSSSLGIGPKTIRVTQSTGGAAYHLDGSGGDLSFAANLSWVTSQQFGAIFNEAGNNSINGTIVISGGGGSTYIAVNAGSLTLGNTVSLDTAQTSRPVQLGGVGNGFVFGNLNDNNVGHLSVNKTETGTWTLFGNNSLSGSILVQAGTLAFGSSATATHVTNFNVLSNATLDFSQEGTFTVSAGTTNQTFGGSGTVIGNIAFSNPGFLEPGGTNAIGTLTLQNNLNLNSSSTVVFELGTNTTTGSGSNDFLIVNGNIDAANANIQINPQGGLTSPGTYTLINYGSETSPFNASVVGNNTRYVFTVNDTGAGQVTLGVTGGPATLTWYGGNNAGDWDTGSTFNWNGGTQNFLPLDSVTFDDSGVNGTVTLVGAQQPSSVTVNNSAISYTFANSAKITGVTGLTKSGTNILTIAGANHDFTGPVVVNGGILSVASVGLNGAPSTLGAGTNITLNGGTFQFAGAKPAQGAFNRFWTLGTNGGTVLSTSGVFFIPNIISGPGSLTKTGTVQIILGDILAGVLTNANNTYTGGTFVNQGELQIRSAHALGTGKAVVAAGADLSVAGGGNYGTLPNNIDLMGGDGANSDGTLQVNDANTVINYGGTINLIGNSSVGALNNGNANTFIISGAITNTGSLKKLSTNVVIITGQNTYSGGTLITSGRVQLGNGNVAGTLGAGSVTNNATLAYNHTDFTTNTAAISGTGLFIHGGSGTLTLSGADTYTGTTTVSAGTLLVAGSLGTNTVTVATNATLGGSGVINGAVTVQNGGTLAPGSSLPTLTVRGALTLNSNSTTVMGVQSVGGITNNQVTGMSTVMFNGALNITAFGTMQGGEVFQLFTATNYAGAFTATNLPALASGLTWDTSSLSTGVLKVSGGAPPAPKFTQSPFQLANGTFQLKFSGTSGSYRLWATTNITLSPLTNTWSNLTGGTFSGGTVTFTDTQATNFSKRFYTITQP